MDTIYRQMKQTLSSRAYTAYNMPIRWFIQLILQRVRIARNADRCTS